VSVDEPGSREDEAGVADCESVLMVVLDSTGRRSTSIGGGGSTTIVVGVAMAEFLGSEL
jgi:hypothetical protein